MFSQKLGSGLETLFGAAVPLSSVVYGLFSACERVSVPCESEKIPTHTHQHAGSFVKEEAGRKCKCS